LAGLNALQGESLSFDTESSFDIESQDEMHDEVQDEPCPMSDKSLLLIGTEIHPAPEVGLLQQAL
jgi:hypothetical protein